MLSEIKKHLKIYAHLVKVSAMQQMEYRVNFILAIIVECTWVILKSLYVFITQKTGGIIGGSTPDEIMLFIGTFMILTAIYIGLFSGGFNYISWGVRNGEFDMLIPKPVSLQFISTMRWLSISVPIPNIIAGVILISIAWDRIGLSAGIINIFLYIYLIFCGILVAYSILIIPHILSFWTVKTYQIAEISYRLWDFNNMPMQIYNKWWQRAGIFLIPVFVITNFPVMALFNNLPPLYLIWGIIIPVILFLMVRLFWKFAIKRYSSAGG